MILSVRSSVRSEFSVWNRGVVGSNPTAQTNNAPLAQLVEATALEAVGSRFESVAGHHTKREQ